MPELPEVETIRIGLHNYIKGLVIKNIDIKASKQFSGDPNLVIDSKIVGVRRFGKALVIDFSNGISLVIHVKMTGQMIYVNEDQLQGNNFSNLGQLPNKYTRVIIYLNNGAKLFYNDIRRFGWLKVVPSDKIFNLPYFNNLGFDAMTGMALEKFINILKKSERPIKVILMDQKLISGIGNIYANEALHSAKIDPNRRGLSLSFKEQNDLLDALKAVLSLGLEKGGASVSQYVNVLGKKGSYQDYLQVYKREGKACFRCGNTIKRTVLAGRGTFFCEGCQK